MPDPPASLRLFGRFELHIGGQLVDQGGLRPRVRSLLQLLALHVNTPLHREVITEALWPAADPVSSTRNLHVAVASLRRVLEPDATRGGFRLVRRDGEAYIFALPPGSVVDLIGFEQAVEEARQAMRAGTSDAVERWCATALERYRGDLLVEAGPAEWVLWRREALRNAAVEVTTLLAGVLLDRGDHVAAAATASEGLGRDRYHDPLWRIVIAARELAGDRAAATSARAAYEQALAELGVDPPVARRWRAVGARLAT